VDNEPEEPGFSSVAHGGALITQAGAGGTGMLSDVPASAGAAGRGALTALLAVLLLAEPVAPWHAFADQERMPDVPGTSVRSDFTLPRGTGDRCATAAASLRKALLVCGDGFPCDLKCAAAWNSAMRDTRRIIDNRCGALEALMNQHLQAGLVREDGAFELGEWGRLKTWCERESVCGRASDHRPLVNPCSDTEGQCRDRATRTSAAECVQLAPPASVCPVFAPLTWLALQGYQERGLGCVGGLSDLADEEYSTWACIHNTSCPSLVTFEDFACFKYSHIRGEFHFWDLNSNLKLVPPLSQVYASFCLADGTPTLRDARSGQPITLSTVTFMFERYLGANSLETSKSGHAPDLGNGGCGTFQLPKRSKFRVQIDAGDAYYKVSDKPIVIMNRRVHLCSLLTTGADLPCAVDWDDIHYGLG